MSSDALPVDLRRARGADTRAQILEAARDELAGEGYGNTTTRSIAERAGVQLSLVHYHFGGKQQLLAAVLVSENERLLERQRALFDGPELARGEVARGVRVSARRRAVGLRPHPLGALGRRPFRARAGGDLARGDRGLARAADQSCD